MTHVEALIAFIAAAGWLAIIILLHLVKRELRPSIRLISEYARPPHGWIMQFAFFCAAASCFTMAAAAWSLVSVVSLILLTLGGAGFAGAGLFVTDPVFIGRGAETTSGKLHVLFAFATMVVFPIMATMFDLDVGSSGAWPMLHPWLPALTIVVWAGLAVFLFASVYSARHQDAPVGYAERFLVLTFTVWLLVVSFASVWL